MKNNTANAVSKNLSLINELAFSIGNSLDLRENCDAFCTLLLARKNFSFVSVWLNNDVLQGGRPTGEVTCVYAYPAVMSEVTTLPEDHLLFAPLREGRAVSYGEQDAEFHSFISEKRIRGGAYAIYPLGSLGVLKIYAQNRDGAFSAEELAQLRNVIRKFAVSVQGCLSHKALVDEICERNRAEKHLHDSKNALQSLIDSISEPAGLIRKDGSVIVGNTAFFKLHTFLRDKTYDPDTRGLHSSAMEGMVGGFACVLEERKPEIIEVEVRNYLYEMHLTPVVGTTGEVDAVAFFTIDITEKRKEMLAQLRKSEQQFRELSDFIPIILYDCDETGMVTFANQTAYSALKLNPGMLDEGLNLRDCIVPEDISRGESCIAEVALGGRIQGMQFTIRRMDGTTFPALSYKSPILRDGTFGGVHGAVIDISDQIMAKEALRRTNLKLSLLSSVTRHDILNQVTAMLLFKELLADTIAEGKPVDAEYVSHIFDNAETIERQILFSRDYHDIGMNAPRWQHVGHIVTTVSRNVELSALDIVCTTGKLEMYADHLFEKVIFNLMDNSLRHGFNVSSMVVTWEPDAGGGGILTFADDGVGVPDGMKEQIFEKGFGSNTGYGLYLIREILELTGISIEETGTVGKGAKFSLTIPPGACRNCSPAE